MVKIMKIIFVVLILNFLALPAFSSQEGVLPLSEFLLKSDGIGNSGMIIVEGKKDSQGIFTKLNVKAFGKTFDVSGEPLKRFPIKAPNGIQLSYDEGNKETGGRTVYINFLLGTSQESSKSVFMLKVSEDGKQEIYLRMPRQP